MIYTNQRLHLQRFFFSTFESAASVPDWGKGAVDIFEVKWFEVWLLRLNDELVVNVDVRVPKVVINNVCLSNRVL